MSEKKEPIISDPKPKKDPLKLAIDSNPCAMCRAMGLPSCKGHAAKSGGGSGRGSNGETKKEDTLNTSNKIPNAADKTNHPFTYLSEKEKNTWMESQLFNDKTVNYETGLLSVESDRLRGNLTFNPKPGLSEADAEIVKQFLTVIIKEFDAFKDQLADKGISTRNFTAELKDDQLKVHIPIPKYYDAFIKHLENKNLLPIPNPNLNQQQEIQNDTAKRPSPFADLLKGPKPKGWE